jgi:hypothetical protein
MASSMIGRNASSASEASGVMIADSVAASAERSRRVSNTTWRSLSRRRLRGACRKTYRRSGTSFLENATLSGNQFGGTLQ